MGGIYDWSKAAATRLPVYYKWNQWFFLKLYELGLAYRAKAPVNWFRTRPFWPTNRSKKGTAIGVTRWSFSGTSRSGSSGLRSTPTRPPRRRGADRGRRAARRAPRRRPDGASKTKKQISSSGTWIERSKRTQPAPLRQLLRGRARPPLARARALPRGRGRGRSRRGSSARRSTLGRRRRGGNVRTSELCSRRRLVSQPPRELGARAHAELGVDVGQVARHGPLAEEQRGRDLAVRPALGDEGGDAALGRGQPFLAPAPADPRRARRAPSSPSRPRRAARTPSSAASIASRAARFWRARRRTTPSASSARARPKGSPTRLVLRRPPARGASSARSTSPRAAATRPRQRVTCASTHSRPTRVASASQASRSSHRVVELGRARAAARRGRASTSGGSARPNRAPPPGGRRSASHSAAADGSPLQSATSPRTAMCCGGWKPNCSSASSSARSECARARSSWPRWTATTAIGRWSCGTSRPYWIAMSCARAACSAASSQRPGPELDPREAPERAGAPRLVAVAPLAVLALEQRAAPRVEAARAC